MDSNYDLDLSSYQYPNCNSILNLRLNTTHHYTTSTSYYSNTSDYLVSITYNHLIIHSINTD